MMDMHASSPFLIPCMAGGKALPGGLRQALEYLSGLDMSDVRVHYHSPWPERFGARAFAFGCEIHLGPQSEAALAHEAWHVVQQKQGRVVANGSVAGVGMNDEAALEREADWMGEVGRVLAQSPSLPGKRRSLLRRALQTPLLQRAIKIGGETYENVDEPQDSAVKGNRMLFVRLHQNMKQNVAPDVNYVLPDKILLEILADFHRERATFANWPACLREVVIRNVGYQAEAKMREIMNENEVIVKEMVKEFDARKDKLDKQLKQDLALVGSDATKKLELERVCKNALHGIAVEEKDAEGFLKWTNPSYFTAVVDLELAAWVLGFTDKLPSSMNCWEAVIFSLVRSGVVDKSYITWANKTISIAQQPAWLRVRDRQVCPNFLEAAMRNVEKYWHVGDNDTLNIPDKKQELPQDWKNKDMVRLPPDLLIPRGRVVILNFGSHVVLSTGKNIRIESKEARNFFATEIGHGILELDKAENGPYKVRSIKETTIEDLIGNGGTYLKHIAYVPFPHTLNSYKASVDKDVKPSTLPSIEEAVEDFLAKQEGAIKNDIDAQAESVSKNIEKIKNKITENHPSYVSNEVERKKLEARLSNLERERNGLETNIRNKWREKAMRSDSVQQAIEEWGTVNSGKIRFPVEFSWKAMDIYYGLVRVV